MVTVNFAKMYLLGQNGQFGPNLGKNYATLFFNLDLDLTIFFRCLSMIRHNKKSHDSGAYFIEYVFECHFL